MKQAILRIHNLSANFPDGIELVGISFSVLHDECLCLTGAYDSGLDHLINILVGKSVPDGGQTLLDEQEYSFSNEEDIRSHGIYLIGEQSYLDDNSDIPENLFLPCREYFRKYYPIKWRKTRLLSEELLADYGMDVSVNASVSNLSAIQRDCLEIIKLVNIGAKVIIMNRILDGYSINELRQVYNVIQNAKKRHCSFIISTGDADRLTEITDRTIVFRNGFICCIRDKASYNTFGFHDLLENKTCQSESDYDAVFPCTRYISSPLLNATLSSSGTLEIHTQTSRIIGLLDSNHRFSDALNAGIQEKAPLFPDNIRIWLNGDVISNNARHSKIAYFSDSNIDEVFRGLLFKDFIVMRLLNQLKTPFGNVNRRMKRFVICDCFERMHNYGFSIPKPDTLDLPVEYLSTEQKISLALYCITLQNPDVLIVNSFSYLLDQALNLKIMRCLKAMTGNGCSVISISSNVEYLGFHCERIFHL